MAVMAQQRLRAFSARRFIGKNVYDVTGDRIGEVDDLIVDMQSACAKYAIVGVGGFLGMGERHYIVPTQAISMNTDTGALMLNVDRGRLANAPTFDRDNPPDFNDEQWSSSLYTYYGLQAPSQMPMDQGMQSQGTQPVGPGYAGPGPARGQTGAPGQAWPGADQGYTQQQGYQQPIGNRQGGQGGQGGMGGNR